MILTSVPVRTDSDLYGQAYKLYCSAFPECERRTDDEYVRAFSDTRFNPLAILADGKFAGIFFFWDFGEFEFLEHFATLPALRGNGIGARFISDFARSAKKLILEIEPPETPIAVRRKGFYERCGFIQNPYEYRPPVYREGNPQPALRVMSFKKPLSEKEFLRFSECTHEIV